MARTRLELSNGVSLGLTDDIAYSLNFSIADIRTPDKRDANYSKTISIPASKEADRFFKYAFEIDGYDNYNTNLKASCIIYIDDVEQIIGYLQLLNITVTDENLIFYEVTIKGNVSNLIQLWGDKMLTELDMSAFDHVYNKTNQKASWTATIGEGYLYPMIDFGLTNGLTYAVENFYPAIYAKQYIDSAFALEGFTYESDFFDSTFFKRLVVPYNATTLKLSQTELDSRYFKAKRNASYISNPNGAIVQLDTDVVDTGGQFNTGTYTFTATNTGNYVFKHDVNIFYTFTGIATTEAWGGVRVWIEVKKFSGGVYTTVSSTDGYINDGLGSYTNPVSNATITTDLNLVGQSPTVFLNAGEQAVMVVTAVNLASIPFVGTPQLNIKANSFMEGISVNSGLFDGNNLDINNAIVPNVKIKDFFMWLVKRFNLYIEVDKLVTNKYYIEPRDDFYANGETIDWTHKLAIDKPISIRPIGDLDAIEYQFTDKEDKDYFNTKYKTAYGEVYGTKKNIIENDFLKGVKITETGFSPTPLTRIGTTDRIISQIVNLDNLGNVTNIKAFNIRLLYFGGVFTTANPWTYTGFVSGTTTETTYPYVGHLDNPNAPTLDLSFGVPQEVYYDTLTYTNNNSYNRFHRKYIEEITDPDSKIITMYLNLTPFDIQTLDFRNQFFIDKYYLRLNKIYDYNFVNSQLTKCEFVKIKEAQRFTSNVLTAIGGVGVVFDNGDFAPSVRGDGLTAQTFGNVYSVDNSVSTTARACIVTGEGNFIGEGCENIILEGCVRCSIPSGVSNVTLRNCTDLSVFESDLVYEYNQIVTSDASIIDVEVEIASADVLQLNSAPYLLIDAQGVGKVAEVLSAWRALTFNTTTYLVALDLEIFTDTASSPQMELINGLAATANSALKFQPVIATTPATDRQFLGNKGVYLRTKTTDPTTGDSDIKLYITYRIVNT